MNVSVALDMLKTALGALFALGIVVAPAVLLVGGVVGFNIARRASRELLTTTDAVAFHRVESRSELGLSICINSLLLALLDATLIPAALRYLGVM